MNQRVIKGEHMEFEIRKQFSVFLENRVGTLSELCRVISDRSINLLAICAIDTVEEAVLRIIPEKEIDALNALKEAGFGVIETDVFLITLDNIPGATGKVATKLAEGGVNINYIYASAHPEGPKAYLVLRTHQVAEAEEILRGGS